MPSADSAAMILLPAALPPASTQWLREEVDPILRERRKLKQLREQLARQSAIERPQTGHRSDSNEEVGLWRWNIGNTGASDWSPYQDRMLDARIITFPMRRDARADKRTDAQKALDGIRGRK